MKKKLVAIAVAGLLIAPLAQAQTANVTLYGRLNMDVDFTSSAKEDDFGKLNRVSSNSSRIGFKGTESLGGGLNAIFQIESAVAADTGGGTLASRDTWLGLQGGWGTVKLGYMFTPYDDLHGIFGNSPTYLTSILATTALWANGGTSRENGNFDSRTKNSVRYDSPNLAGFTGKVQYATDETDNHGWVGSVGVFYDNAGLQVGGVYETNQSMRADGLNDQTYTVTAAYNFGFIRPAAVYEHTEYENIGTGKSKRDLYGASLTAPIGKGTLYGSYLYADKVKGAAAGTRVGDFISGSDTGAQMANISYSYPLSKRTVSYVGYNYIHNDDNAVYTFGVNGNRLANGNSAVTPGTDQQGLVLGAVHFF